MASDHHLPGNHWRRVRRHSFHRSAAGHENSGIHRPVARRRIFRRADRVMAGHYQMHRNWMDNPIFGGEPFTRAQAWCWMIEEAGWQETKVGIAGKTVVLDRGQFSHSQRFMAAAWEWDKAKVERFVYRLKTEAMIETATEAGQLVITVCNYEKYQTTGPGGEAVTEVQNEAGARQGRGRGEADLNKEKREEGKKVEPPPIGPPPSENPDPLGIPEFLDKRRRGTRLPENWVLPPDWRAWAEAERPGFDVNREAAIFADYWHGVPGQKGVKLDWLGTWRNWIRRAKYDAGNGRSRPLDGFLAYADRCAQEDAAAASDAPMAEPADQCAPRSLLPAGHEPDG